MPKSLDDYIQQIGRGGRDGDPSECVLFFHPSDAESLGNLIRENRNYRVKLSEEYYESIFKDQAKKDGFGLIHGS